MTAYMFNAQNSLFLRGLSLFHGWLPFLLLYLVAKLGYDRRALLYWTVLAWVLILICFFFMPPPNPNAGLTPVNINYVWGLNDAARADLDAGLALGDRHDGADADHLFFLPVHYLFSRLMPKAPSKRPSETDIRSAMTLAARDTAPHPSLPASGGGWKGPSASRSRCALRCAICAAGCAASTCSSPASRSA